MRKFLTILAGVILSAAMLAGQSFEYAVTRDKLFRDEPGTLRIGLSGLRYESDNGKTSLQIALTDLRRVDISNPKTIRVQTYDLLKRRLMRRRAYSFHLKHGTHDQDLARFLVERLKRPVVGFYELSALPLIEVPVYHRHRLGGCHGVLRITGEAIRFESRKPTDSRTWLYSDIKTIGRMDPFHLRITTFIETYNLDLKKRLSDEEYRLIWEDLYDAGQPSR